MKLHGLSLPTEENVRALADLIPEHGDFLHAVAERVFDAERAEVEDLGAEDEAAELAELQQFKEGCKVDIEEVLAAAEADGFLLNNLFVGASGRWRAEFRRKNGKGSGYIDGDTPRQAVLNAFAQAKKINPEPSLARIDAVLEKLAEPAPEPTPCGMGACNQPAACLAHAECHYTGSPLQKLGATLRAPGPRFVPAAEPTEEDIFG